MQLQRLIQKDLFAASALLPTQAGDSEIIKLNYADRLSVQAVYTVSAPGTKTFASGVAALLTNQSVTYTANTRGTAGNSISITLVDPGTTHSLAISTVGNDISVTLAYAAGNITTTATQLVAAINADSAAHALITASGAGASPLTALVKTNLATGADSAVNVSTNQITISAHGYTTGFKVQLTSTGTLPAGLSTSTDYFVIVIDANTIQYASSLANALAGTAIDLTDQGSSGAVNTSTGVALAGASIGFYCSNEEDGSDWTLITAATTITTTGSTYFAQPDVAYRRFKCVKGLTAGVVDLKAYVLVSGGTA